MAGWPDMGAGDWAVLVAAVAMLVLAALLLAVDLGNRVHRAFALFLFFRALLDGSFIFHPSIGDLAWRLRGYLFIAVPFAVVYFSIIYRQRYERRRTRDGGRRIAFVILAVALVAEGLYVRDHGLLSTDSDSFGALSPFFVLPQVVYAGIAALFAHDFSRHAAKGPRLAPLLAAIGLSMEPLFYSSFRAIDFALDRVRGLPFDDAPFNVLETGVSWLTLPIIALAGIFILRGARALRQPAFARRVAIAWGVTMASAAVPAIMLYRASPGPEVLSAIATLTFVRAIWLLGLPALVTYALVRHHLFDADIKLRFAIKGTTLAAIFLGVAFILSEGAQEFFGRKSSNAYFGIFGASLLVFAMAPLQRFADRLAQAAVPAATPLSQLSPPERVRIYREQLEIAWSDGHLTRKERLLFDRLRERLGMSPSEAAMLESEVVAHPAREKRRPAAR